MAIKDFFQWRAPEAKKSSVASVIFQGQGRARWTDQRYDKLAIEGYQKNVVAYRCVNIIADAVAAVAWEVWENGKLLETHPYYNIIDRPNPAQSGIEFMRAKASNLMIGGNAFDERIVVRDNIMERYTLRPDRMKIVDGHNHPWPSRYEYSVGGRKQSWDVDQKNGKSDVRHYKLYNPVDDWYGQSPLWAGRYGVDQHNEAMTWIQSLLQNAARPSGALIQKGETLLSDEQFARLKSEMESQYSGASNAGRPMLLEGGLDWQEMGLSPADMAVIDTKYSAAVDIAMAYGVPPQLVGIPQNQTYNNYEQARLSFWEDTVLPLIGYIGAEDTAWAQQIYGDGFELRANLDAIPAIADKRAKMWDMADKATDLTVNERRHMKGFPEIDGGDAAPLSAELLPQEVAELHKLAASVADGMFPAESAIAIAKAAYPQIKPEVISEIMNSAKGFQANIDFEAVPNEP